MSDDKVTRWVPDPERPGWEKQERVPVKRGRYPDRIDLERDAQRAIRSIVDNPALDLTLPASLSLMYEQGRKFGQDEGRRHGYDSGYNAARRGQEKRRRQAVEQAESKGYRRGTDDANGITACQIARGVYTTDVGEDEVIIKQGIDPSHSCRWCPEPYDEDDER